MRTICINFDELYPFYYFHPIEDLDFGKKVEISDKLFQEMNSKYKIFEELQDKLKELYRGQSNA